MALVTILEETLTNIANAIRSRNGQDTKYKVSEMSAAIDNLHTEKYQPKKISFYKYSGNNLDYELNNLDISRITDMSDMFNYCDNLMTLDISNWDVSKVTNMSNMFNFCDRLTTLDVSNWNVSKVTNMSDMFFSCDRLTTLNLSNWNVSNVTNMNSMFSNCTSLKTLDISNWNVSNVTDMSDTFSGGWFFTIPLTDDSLKSILKMLKTATSLSANNKNLKYLGFTNDQATKCTTFAEWNDLVSLGWTTGY